MNKNKGQFIFFTVQYWELLTTGKPTLLEIENHAKSSPPAGTKEYVRYCPNCEEQWQGRYHEDLTCGGCGGGIKETEVISLLPSLVGHLRYLNHE